MGRERGGEVKLTALPGLKHFLPTQNPSKMIKNHFHFTLKAIFILKTIKFLSWLFANVGKRRNKKAKVNFKIYDVIISKKIIAIQILPIISRSKNNQTIRIMVS